MGGRHSSQNSNHSQRQVPTRPSHRSNPVRFSISSLDNVSGRSGSSLPSGQSVSTELESSPSDRAVSRRRRRRDRNNFLIETQSLPAHLFPTFLSSEIKCPVCNKRIGSDEIETHLLVCLSKPRVSYNEDILKTEAGECIICFDEMVEGDRIARLPCFCIYHKRCLDDWFQRNRCCPEHPNQIANQEILVEENSTEPSTSTNNVPIPSTQSNISSQNLTSLISSDTDLVGATALSTTSQDEDITNETEAFPNIVPLPLDNMDDIQNDSIDRQNLSPSSQLSNIQEVLSQNSSYVNLDTSQDSIDSPQRKTVVHVDDGSIHGSPSLFNDDDLAQLASKIKTILVAESPRSPVATESSENT